ncbi:MAG: OsmC family protein [Catenulispora sp.]|nr:OsmC family protein [Catenulispora sp.]
MTDYEVIAGAGTLRRDTPGTVTFPHRWTAEGVTVDAAFTGAHLLHLATAGCVLNDVYREAARRGMEVGGVRVTATGAFDTATWESTGITYRVEVDAASTAQVEALLDAVDAQAEIPKAIRAGAAVTRVP